jgi:type IV fimbrial biogenesis protein FimT
MHTSMQGMTLVEMMVVLALIGIGMTIAKTSFNAMIGRNQAATQINEMVSALNLARSEASKRSSVVRIQSAGAAGNEYGGGWCVIAGLPSNVAAADIAECAPTTAIRVFPALPGDAILKSNLTTVQFNGLGELVTNLGARTDVSTVLNFCSSNKKRNITIAPIGRISIGDADADDC